MLFHTREVRQFWILGHSLESANLAHRQGPGGIVNMPPTSRCMDLLQFDNSSFSPVLSLERHSERAR